MRQLLCLLLMICLPLQGFAMQWGAAFHSVEAGSLAHEVLHDEHVSHHHDEDGSVHFDASEESSSHVQDHSCTLQLAALFTPDQACAPRRLVETITIPSATPISDPMLELPHRPPAPALG